MPSAIGVLIIVGLWALVGTVTWALLVALGLRFDDDAHGPILDSKSRLPVWNLERRLLPRLKTQRGQASLTGRDQLLHSLLAIRRN
ncbi:MAG: hypothetical protein OEO79_13770 [Gemmatimonadota bacterium]|nr:hypothetical protein [Gemmatimonadota bacterium]